MNNIKYKAHCLSLISFVFALFSFSNYAFADNFSFTGNLSDPNQIQSFNFTVGSSSNITLQTWSYAGGTNAAGNVIARGGFDSILALFDSSGALIGQNDDGGASVAADSVTGEHYDTFLQPPTLSPGVYTVSIMQYPNFAIGPNLSNGFNQAKTDYYDVTGNLRDSHWAFDILNVAGASEISAVPEPETYALMLGGLGLMGFIARRRNNEKV